MPRTDHRSATLTTYRVIRIDAEYDPARQDLESATEYAVHKAISAIRAQMSGIEEGIRLTGADDCGESN